MQDQSITNLPRSDRFRMWAGMRANTLPDPLAREIQLATFVTALRVYNVLSVIAAIAAVTITATLIPLGEPRGQLWAAVHVAEYGLIVWGSWSSRKRIGRRDLTLPRFMVTMFPSVLLAGVLWGFLPLAAGTEDPAKLYISTGVASVFAAFGFFWLFGSWPLSIVYSGVGLSLLSATLLVRDPRSGPMYTVLAVLLLFSLIALSLVASYGLIRSMYDSALAPDRQQCIDLLLQDHERGGLDFLWETDDDLRLAAVPKRMVVASRGDTRVGEGQSLLDLIDDPTARSQIREGKAFSARIITHGPHGTGELRLSGRPKPISGSRVGYRGIGTDAATARSAAEAERIRERLDTMVALTGGLAHDFNNQLSTVLGSVELALLDDGMCDKSRSVLGRATEACLRTRRITADLVAASGHSTTYEAAPFELVEAVNHVVADVCPLYPDVAIATDAGEPVWVNADKSQFMRTVRNLVENGCQAVLDPALPPDCLRLVNVTVERRTVGSEEWAVTEVVDTGPGLDADHEGLVFEPFFTTRRDAGGTGLGLSIARGFAHQANGSVRATNREQGAEFQLLIPPVAAPAYLVAPRSEIERDHDYTPTIDGLVLVVEDDPGIALNVCQLLETFGARVEIASSVDQAVIHFLDRVADLECVISDLALPDGEGFEVVAAFRQKAPALKAVYMSGFTTTLPSTVAPELRCPFLPKPFSVTEFIDALRLAGVGAPTIDLRPSAVSASPARLSTGTRVCEKPPPQLSVEKLGLRTRRSRA